MLSLTANNIDSILADLAQNRTRWASTSSAERLALLTELRRATHRVAARWAGTCCGIKGIASNAAVAGQEWAVGPLIVLRNLRTLQDRLLRAARRPKKPLLTIPGGVWDVLAWPGLWAHTWPREDPTPQEGEGIRGVVSLVLGAGNVSSISATDVLYKLFVEDQVVLLKMNPVHEPLGPVLEEAFDCLIRFGVLRIVSGDGAAGALACAHPVVETIHVTGSHQTYDAIRKSLPVPKPITAELGCVSPVLISPGRWSRRDLEYQARHIAGMLTTNAGFNCNAAQLLVTWKGWAQREEFLTCVRQALTRVPGRSAYYPGAQQRYQALRQSFPQAEALGPEVPGGVPWTLIAGLDPERDRSAFQKEAFCGVLQEVALADTDENEFLLRAADFCNDSVWGNLSCTILLDGYSSKHQPWREAVRRLRYGAIGINIWAGVMFALVDLPWGAYPGNRPEDIQSGIGFVHNTGGVELPLKSVLRAPFWTPYLPPWHASHPRMLELAQALTDFEFQPGLWNLGRAMLALLRGTLER